MGRQLVVRLIRLETADMHLETSHSDIETAHMNLVTADRNLVTSHNNLERTKGILSKHSSGTQTSRMIVDCFRKRSMGL